MEKIIHGTEKLTGSVNGLNKFQIQTKGRVDWEAGKMGVALMECKGGMEFRLMPGAVLHIGNGANLLIRTGTKVHLGEGARVIVGDGGYIHIEAKADIAVEGNDAGFRIERGGKIGVDPGLRRQVGTLKKPQDLPMV